MSEYKISEIKTEEIAMMVADVVKDYKCTIVLHNKEDCVAVIFDLGDSNIMRQMFGEYISSLGLHQNNLMDIYSEAWKDVELIGVEL